MGNFKNQSPSHFVIFRKLASLQKEYLKLDLNFPPHNWPTHKDNRRRDAFVLALYYDNDVTLTTDAPCFAKHNTFETGTCLDVRKLLSKFTLERIEQVCTL